ncbi:MAG: type II toxin-antitoxin system PemK/MazF family toxin [Candidatus Bipolaricaulia bacterium]
MKRGEVWWADIPPLVRRRPAVLVSRDEAYRVRALVTIAPVTTRIRGIKVEVELGPKDGLPRKCVANCDSLATIPKAWLQSRIAMLDVVKVQEINEAIKFALDLP